MDWGNEVIESCLVLATENRRGTEVQGDFSVVLLISVALCGFKLMPIEPNPERSVL
jgi:hypothetical protein